MQIEPFKLERYFARYEFAVEHLLSSSDVEPLTTPELLAYATPEARAAYDNLWLGYTESQGHPALREAVAAMYDRIDPAEIIGVVPEEGIFIVMNTLLEPGDHVVVTSPAYQSLYAIAEAIGCTVSHWRPNPDDWTFDVEALRDLVTPDTRLIVVNFPHNPTGATLSNADFAAVVEIAREHGCYIFSDEMYRWSERHADDRLPSACEVYERAVSLCGLSKTFALPGLRVGWLVTRDADLMPRFQAFKDYTTICGSAPSEALAMIALGATEPLIDRTLGIVNANIDLFGQFVAQHADVFRWGPPAAGTVSLVELIADVPVDTFATRLVEGSGVMVVPASQFGYEGNTFRLGLGRRSLPDALEALEGALPAALG